MEKGQSQNRRRKRRPPVPNTRAYSEPALSHRVSRHLASTFMRHRSAPAYSDKDPDHCPRELQLVESIMKFLKLRISPQSDKHKSNEQFVELSVEHSDLEKLDTTQHHSIPTADMLHGAKPLDSDSTSPASARGAVALSSIEHEGSPSQDHAFAPNPRPSQEPSTRDYNLDFSRPDPSREGSKEPWIGHDQPLDLQPSDPAESDSWIAGLAPLITELVNQQRDASAARSHLREVRIALRHKRDEEAEYRATFMKRINPLVSNGEFGAESIDKGAIAADYQALQTATQEYLEMENTYHQTEDKLGVQEYMLNKSMERLAKFSQGAKPPSYQDAEMFRPVVDDLINDDASSYNSTPQDLPAGIREYLFRIGDVQILQERLHNLDVQRASIIGRQEQRNMYHIPIDGESWEFLEGFEEEWKETWEDLNQAHLDAAELEWICEESGILTDDYRNRLDYIYQFDIIYQTSEIGDVDIFSHIDDPLKLPSADLETKEQPFFFEALPDGPDGPASFSERLNAPKVGKAQYYNRWTWHQLRISTLQIHLLKGQVGIQKLLYEGMDDTTLGELAETEWFKDNPAPSRKSPSQDDGYLTDERPAISGSGLQMSRKHTEPVESSTSFHYIRGRDIRSNRPQPSVAQELPT